ncbi:MAG TPA: FtsX-like permease family protein, partial [Bryobacteraceae bacterium]
SLCLLGVLIAVYHALFYPEQTPSQALRLIVRHRVSLGQAIPRAFEEKIRHVPGVREVTVWNWFGGSYKDARDPKNFFARLGVEPKAFFTLRSELKMPEDQRQAFIHDRQGCVVSRDLAEKLGFQVGQRITLVGDIYPVNLDLHIVGIFDDSEAPLSMFFNWEYLSNALPVARRNFISIVAALADDPDHVPQIAKTIDDMFANSAYPTKTESEQQFALSFLSFLGNIKMFLLAICAAVTFTILLVSGNTMAMSVRERIKEVGVLKTLGFNNDSILGIIVGEAVTIAMIGGVVGLVFAFLLTAALRNAAGSFMPQLQHLSITPLTALLALGVALLIGIVSSFIPAWNAARTNILDSLRYAG